MIVADVMSRDVEFVDPHATVQEAAVLMGELEVGALPVGAPESLQGIVTDRDILYRVVAQGLDSSRVRVLEIMSSTVFSCREEDPIESAMDLMGARSVRRLPVVDAAGRVTGWLTLADLARRLLVDSEVMQRALADVAGIGP